MSILRIIKHRISIFYCNFLFAVFHLFPLQDKIVATTFKGKKYGDNPQYIYERIHECLPCIKLLWLKDKRSKDYSLPTWIQPIEYRLRLRTLYHVATAKVLIDTHRYPLWIKKRAGQLFIETWHGGLGLKKIEGDVPAFKKIKVIMDEVEHTNKLSDVFISQSDHLSNIFRRAFGYKGIIWKCGYPKNDMLFGDKELTVNKVRSFFRIPNHFSLFMYAPSFRDSFYEHIDVSVYDVDFEKLKASLETKFGGSWAILVHWHPLFAEQIKSNNMMQKGVIDVTSYSDMQELILASDIVMSDYSSCIFDAALRDIPCFTFATDFEAYKAERGVYYEMEELPFPYARNNEELIKNVMNYDHNAYIQRWKAFKIRTGLHETGHASVDIANKIMEHLSGKKVVW